MKKPFHSRGLVTLMLAAFSLGAYQADAQVVQINTGAASAPLYAVGPIYMSSTLFYRDSRYAYLYTQAELEAVGFMPGTVISTVGWMKNTSNSAAGPATFSIYMKNSSVATYSASTESWANLSSGATSVYTNSAQAIPATASPTYIDFALSSPFTYTGGSLEILTEWDISVPSAPIATGAFEWVNTTVVDRIYGMGGSSLPATLSSTDNNTSIDNKRPVVQFTIDNGTGIHEDLDAKISIWPDPAEQFIQIRNESNSPLETMMITDAVGKVVYSEKLNGIQADHRINVEQLMAGTYMLGIQTPAGRIVKRFIVL